MHSGVKYTNRNEHQPPSVIIRNSSINDVIIPTGNIHYISGDWHEAPIFPMTTSSLQKFYEIKQFYENKFVQILLPLEIENIINEYIFTFEIEKVELVQGSLNTPPTAKLKAQKQENAKLDSLFKDENTIFLDIEKAVSNYILVMQRDDIVLEQNNIYKILRKRENKYLKIGIARVVKIKGIKVALEVELQNPENEVTTKDKIEYIKK